MSRAEDLFGKKQWDRAGEADTTNHEGFLAFTRDLEDQYLQLLMTNTLGNSFYVKQQENVAKALDLHRQMLTKNPWYMAKAAVYARENGYTRLQPAIALAFLSTAEDKTPFRLAFQHIIKTPNNLFDFLTIASNIRKGKFGFGRTIKTAVGKWFNRLSEYHVMKYGADKAVDQKTGQKAYDLRDILKLVRPVPANARQAELFKYILDKEVDFKQLPQLKAVEDLKKSTNFYEAQGIIERGRIPHEVATGAFQRPNTETWEYIMMQMPIFALLRNLNTLDRHGVFKKDENITHVVRTFSNADLVANAKILPFRWLTAMQNFKGDRRIGDAIRMGLNLSFKAIPEIKGKTHISIDLSGSMSTYGVRDTAVIFGVAAYMNAEDAELTAFDLRLYDAPVSRMDSMMTNVDRFQGLAGGGTALALPIEHLIGEVPANRYYNNWHQRADCRIGYATGFPEAKMNKRTKVDNIVIVTDEQQTSGQKGLLSAFSKYRALVNRNAKLFVVNVGPYDKYGAPSDEPNVFQIFGWSDEVLRYISMVSQGGLDQRKTVEAMELGAVKALS